MCANPEEMDVDTPISIKQTTKEGLPIKASIEGFVIIALNIHEEASEEDLMDYFEEFGKVRNIHLNLDRQTGYVKGYTLIEYSKLEEAARAVKEADGEELLGHILSVDFAFVDDESLTKKVNKDDISRQRDRSPVRD